MLEIGLSVEGEAQVYELDNPKLTTDQVHHLVRGFLTNYGRVRVLDEKRRGFQEDNKKGDGKKG